MHKFDTIFYYLPEQEHAKSVSAKRAEQRQWEEQVLKAHHGLSSITSSISLSFDKPQ